LYLPVGIDGSAVDALVGRDGERVDLDQVVVEALDQDAGVEVVRGGPFR
jgi:hypothetical protein